MGYSNPKSSAETGDIESVTAGDGLTGGGSSGPVTVALATPVTVARGGTGGATASDARTNLGLGSAAVLNAGTGPSQLVQMTPRTSAVGTITMTGVATADQTFTVAGQTFTWKALRTVTGEVTIGASAAEACTNIIAAITADLNSLTDVAAADGAGDTVVVTAAAQGPFGNLIPFTNVDSANMSFDGTGTLGGTTLGAWETLPAVNGSQLTGISAGFTPNYAVLWHAGAATAYATITLAQTAAASGDTIEVHGMMDENLLGKDGVTYHFPTPNDGITYTGADTGPLFSDEGANITFHITGRGTFYNNAASGNKRVLQLTASTGTSHFSCFSARGTNGVFYLQSGTQYVSGDLFLGDGSQFFAVWNTVYIDAGTINCAGQNYAVFTSAGIIYLRAGVIYAAYGSVYASGGKIVATVGKIDAVGGYGARTTGGELHLTVTEGLYSDNDPAMDCASGTLRFRGYAKTSASGGSCLKLGGTCVVYGGSALVANGAGYPITADSALNVKLYGHVVGNAANHANVTVLCGAYEADSDVT